MTEETLHLSPRIGAANLELLKILNTYHSQLILQNEHYHIARAVANLLAEFGIRDNNQYSIGHCLAKVAMEPLLG